MRRLLLDTSAYSALFRGHGEILDAVQRAGEVCLSTIVLGELRAGFRKGSRRLENEALLEEFLSSPPVRLLSLDEETAEFYALIADSLRIAGTPLPTNDVWIAASAMQHGLEVLTTDAHFRHVAQIRASVVSP